MLDDTLCQEIGNKFTARESPVHSTAVILTTHALKAPPSKL